ncbi:MAG: AI-2E family transporter [Faecalimonas sp.]|nr:AI-2E family transporter [Faecalimonas sp.]
MDLDKKNLKKIRGLILFTIFILVALWNYKLLFEGLQLLIRILLPFLIGGGIALVLNTPMSFYERKLFEERKYGQKNWAKKAARPVGFVLALLSVLGVLAIVVFIVVPELGNTVLNLGKTLQKFLPEAQMWAVRVFDDNPELVRYILKLDFEWDKILANIVDFVKSGAGSVIGTTYGAVKSIVSGISTFFIAFVFACYVLLQKERLGRQVRKLMYAFMPRDWADIFVALGSLTQNTFSHFLTGQCLEATILGVMFFIAMSVFQMPYALLISVFIGFMALIPIFGAFIGCALGTILIFIVNPMQALGFIVMFLVLQQIEGNFIYPHVVGNSVGLPPIWVLVAVSVGASLMGVIGMVIFIPIISVVYSMLRGIVNRRLKEREVQLEECMEQPEAAEEEHLSC